MDISYFPSPGTSLRIYFVNYDQSKSNKQRYKMKKKLLCKAVRKCRIKTPIRALGIEVALSKCTGKIVMDNFRCLNGSFFLFCSKTREKKIMAHVRLQMNLPSPPIRASTLLAEPAFHPSQCTYFMDDYQSKNHKQR